MTIVAEWQHVSDEDVPGIEVCVMCDAWIAPLTPGCRVERIEPKYKARDGLCRRAMGGWVSWTVGRCP